MATDPEDLDNVDREIRLNRLHNDVEDHVESGEEAQWPADGTDKGLEYLAAWEDAAFGVRPADLLVKLGVPLPPPDELDEAAFPAALESIIQGLARLGAYLHNTNHLTDAELYRTLWENMLFEETLLIPQDASFAYHWDPLGGCSDEDTRTHLAYHSDDEDRSDWMKQFPEYDMPARQAPKSNRDSRLPQRPEPPPMDEDGFPD